MFRKGGVQKLVNKGMMMMVSNSIQIQFDSNV